MSAWAHSDAGQHAVLDAVPRVTRFVRSRWYGDADERISDALCQLWECALRYNPDVNVPFWAFALTRIRGGLTDYLRTYGPTQRNGTARPLTQSLSAHREGSDRADDFDAAAPDEWAPRNAALDCEHLLSALPAREALVLSLRLDGYDQVLIGSLLGCVESRVSQLEARALGRLRRVVQGRAA